MPFSLTKEFALLCEGPADQVFFEKLFQQRKIKNIDVPPHKVTGDNYGWQALGRFLTAISGDAAGYAKLRGVLIVADSGDEDVATFNAVCRKLAKDGPFSAAAPFVVPPGPYQPAAQSAGHPPIVVMVLPKGRRGALETLCLESIFSRKPELETCVATYLACGGLQALTWSAEKRDKARIQCLIAGLNEKDPNKPLRMLFDVKPPIIHFRSKAFTPLVKEIKNFCASV